MLKTTIAVGSDTSSPHASFAGGATTAHVPKQLQIGYLAKLGTAAENPAETLRTTASAPVPLNRRLLLRNIQPQLMKERNVSTADNQAAPAHKLTQPAVDRASAVSASDAISSVDPNSCVQLKTNCCSIVEKTNCKTSSTCFSHSGHMLG
jgi:hypothetical protein